MSLLKSPNEIVTTGPWAGLIYGEPGTGKSTLALSAPNPVILDADNGMKRIQKRFQTTSLPMTGYQQVLDLMESSELDAFDTIVIDTLGKFVDYIGDYLQQQDPKNRKKGGGLSQQGYGAILVEFARIVREFKRKNKYLLFVAHGKEDKGGDVIKVRPDVAGSSGNALVKELDFMGYVEMHGDDRRTISFSPSERFYAKNSLELTSVIEIPDPNKVGNTFIQKYIIEKQAERAVAEAAENKRYDDLLANICGPIAAVTDAKTADEALATINMAPVLWDSQRVAKHRLAEKVKAVGLVYDKAAKAFVKAPSVAQPAEAAHAAAVDPATPPAAAQPPAAEVRPDAAAATEAKTKKAA